MAVCRSNVMEYLTTVGRPEPWTDKLWVYDLRINKHFTQKQSPITRPDSDEFVACYQPGAMHKRKPTWGEEKRHAAARYSVTSCRSNGANRTIARATVPGHFVRTGPVPGHFARA